MNKFIIKAVCFSAIVFAVFYLLNYVVDKGLRKERDGEFGVWNDIYAGKINADLLVVGSSRAWVHISPAILDSVLGTHSYNTGIDGWTFDMIYARFKVFRQHNKLPKYIVYSMDIGTLGRNKELFNFTQFIPYLNDTIIQKATQGYDGSFSWLDMHAPLLKYRSQYPLFKRGILNNIKPPHDEPGERTRGYQGQEKEWDGSFEKFVAGNKDTTKLDGVLSATVSNFKEFLSFCKDHSIEVIFVYSPEYIEAQKLLPNRDEILSIYKGIAAENHSPFLDYSNDTLCNSKKYFYNSQHLNKLGSEMFSRELAGDLKQYIH